jgi:hypothetical protein
MRCVAYVTVAVLCMFLALCSSSLKASLLNIFLALCLSSLKASLLNINSEKEDFPESTIEDMKGWCNKNLILQQINYPSNNI